MCQAREVSRHPVPSWTNVIVADAPAAGLTNGAANVWPVHVTVPIAAAVVFVTTYVMVAPGNGSVSATVTFPEPVTFTIACVT